MQKSNPIQLLQEDAQFALWQITYKGCVFFYPEAKRGEEAYGPSHDEVERIYQFKLWQHERKGVAHE